MSIDLGFSKIRDFEWLSKRIIDNAKFHNKLAPKLTFTGTVKIHGGNIGVSQKPDGEIVVQTRETIVTPKDDFYGVYQYVQDNLDDLKKIFARVRADYQANDKTIYIFSEYFGQGIQRKVGVKHIKRRFAILDIVIKDSPDSKTKLGVEKLPMYHDLSTDKFMFITQYPKQTIDIDFNASDAELEVIANRLNDIALEVEADCPIARYHLGQSIKEPLIGEGMVWTANATEVDSNHTGTTFKVKGVKHVKQKEPKTAEQLAAMDAASVFAENATSGGRLEQGIFKLQEMLLDPKDIKNTPVYARWVVMDVVSELGHKVIEANLDQQTVNVYVGKIAAQYFKDHVNKE